MQEAGQRGIVLWNATSRQTWAATAFVRMVLYGLAGMRIQEDGIGFEPCMPQGVTRLELGNLIYRATQLSVTISGAGPRIVSMTANGKTVKGAFVPNSEMGPDPMKVEIRLGNR